MPPNAMTIGKRDRQQPDRRRAELRPPEPTATIARMWSRPETGCRKPREEAGRLAALGCAQRAERTRRASTRGGEKRGGVPDPGEPRHRAPREEHRDALDRPERAEGTDGVARQRLTQRGQRISSTRNERSSRRIRPTKPSWPISTPTLNRSSARGISACGRPIAVRPLAKPKPCSRPKANATTHGWRIVRLVSPRHDAHDLGAEEEDGQRDRGVQRRRRRARVAERRRRRASGCGRR